MGSQRRHCHENLQRICSTNFGIWHVCMGINCPKQFPKNKKGQNQGIRLLTGSLRSTPITAMESVTELQSLEQTRDTKILTQLSKFISPKNHPMHSNVEQKHPNRLKRSNFLESARTLQKHLEIPPFDQDEDLPTYQQFPPWNAKAPVVVKDSIPGIATKDSMSLQDLETKTSDFINTNYPSELWIRVYTDGSAEEAVRNVGGGVLIEWQDGKKIRKLYTNRQAFYQLQSRSCCHRRSSGAPPHSQVLQQKHRPSL